eukprot:COSAG05_NODE_1529_length_4623_cov_45.328912_2_plen_326_part_00
MAAAAAILGGAVSLPGIALPMKQTAELFERQIAQDKKFFYASYAEAVAHHSEAYGQAARLHAQSYAQSISAYWQAERVHQREFVQSRMHHREQLEVTMEAEIRDGLRDEFAYKNNRFNTLMVCDTVMLGCAFGLVSDGGLPDPVQPFMAWLYMSGLLLSVSLLTVSLWCSFIVCRRLNQYTAWVLMNQQSRTTGGGSVRSIAEQMNATSIRNAFDNWFKRHCVYLGTKSEQSLCAGVICLFAASFALFYSRMAYSDIGPNSTFMFVACATPTAIFVLLLERREAQHQRMKLPGTVYEKLAPSDNPLWRTIRILDAAGVQGRAGLQ